MPSGSLRGQPQARSGGPEEIDPLSIKNFERIHKTVALKSTFDGYKRKRLLCRKYLFVLIKWCQIRMDEMILPRPIWTNDMKIPFLTDSFMMTGDRSNISIHSLLLILTCFCFYQKRFMDLFSFFLSLLCFVLCLTVFPFLKFLFGWNGLQIVLVLSDLIPFSSGASLV